MGRESLQAAFLEQALAELDAIRPPMRLPAMVRRSRLDSWLHKGLGRTEDQLFARRFARACPVPGVDEDAYLHRVLGDDPTVLAGIRFKGGKRPAFVDLLAWDRPIRRWDRLLAELARHFAAFEPRWVRVQLPGEEPPPVEATVDQVVVAARLSELFERDRPWAWGSLEVERAQDLDWRSYHEAAFESWRASVGELGAEVDVASRSSLQASLDTGAVVCARRQGRWAGVAAAKMSPGRWWPGYEVVELFLDRPLRGQRLAPVVQRALIESLVDRGTDVLWGTIAGNNAPSLSTARRCGRRVVETMWFCAL